MPWPRAAASAAAVSGPQQPQYAINICVRRDTRDSGRRNACAKRDDVRGVNRHGLALVWLFLGARARALRR